MRRHHSIRSAERSIRAIHSQSRPYLRYEVLRACERGHWRSEWQHPLKLMLSWLPGRRQFRVYVVEDDSGAALCIAPLQRDAKGWRIVDDDFVRLNYSDLLYADRPLPELRQAFLRLQQALREDGIANFRIGSLAPDSATNSFAAGFPQRELWRIPAVAIAVPDDWRDYRRGLSASARSNLHKAVSRLRRAGKSQGLEFYSNCGLGEPLAGRRAGRALRECMEFYWHRLGSRYSHRGLCAWMYFHHCNYTTLSAKSPDAFLAVLRIAGGAAAFMQGFVDSRHGSLCVPRVAMNDAFAEFSAGRLLMDECVKWMSANTALRTLDLACGDERYKYDLGGTGYFTREIEISTGGREG